MAKFFTIKVRTNDSTLSDSCARINNREADAPLQNGAASAMLVAHAISNELPFRQTHARAHSHEERSFSF